jgi:hypothetical protein
MDAINRIDALKPNRFEQSEKIKWLNSLDKRIMEDIILTHEGKRSFEEYTDETPLTTVLIAEAPHDDLYLHWLGAQIDYWMGEYSKYNNAIEMFNATYKDFERSYNRKHKPNGNKFKFF